MKSLIQLKMTTLPLLIVFMFGVFGPLPKARATDTGSDIGNFSTADGLGVLLSNTGVGNSGFGYFALNYNTTGGKNTANGAFALRQNTRGNGNTAYGYSALHVSTIASNNTAVRALALFENATGGFNTAVGVGTLYNNTTAGENTAVGYQALENNTTGIKNTAIGVNALDQNIAGPGNTAVGAAALFNNNSNYNTAVGYQALHNSTGNNNIAIGSSAGSNLTTGSYNIDIGDTGAAGDSARIRIGVQGTQTATNIAGIVDSPISGTGVVVNSFGRLGVASSSVRFKHEIKPMEKASEAIFALKPVTFRYKKQIDSKGIPQFGLLAEDVEKINPDLVVRDGDGKPYTVRYDAVNAMLLNEFLKEHRKNEEQEAMIARLQEQIAYCGPTESERAA